MIIGTYVVQWDIGVWLKSLIISVASVPAILLVYEVLVKRTNATRFLFGDETQASGEKAPASARGAMGDASVVFVIDVEIPGSF